MNKLNNFIFAICLILCSTFLIGCATNKTIREPVIVEKIVKQTDTIRTTDIKTDSVYIDRWHDVRQKGDTIFVKDTEYKYKYIFKTKTDTIIKIKIDSIPKVVTKESKSIMPDLFLNFVLSLLIVLIVAMCVYIANRKK